LQVLLGDSDLMFSGAQSIREVADIVVFLSKLTLEKAQMVLQFSTVLTASQMMQFVQISMTQRHFVFLFILKTFMVTFLVDAFHGFKLGRRTMARGVHMRN
jgi:hypothetical protein